jgi:hypothetical protein
MHINQPPVGAPLLRCVASSGGSGQYRAKQQAENNPETSSAQTVFKFFWSELV